VADPLEADFLTASGADGPLSLDVTPPGDGATGRRRLDRPFAIVGREPVVDLVLGHEDVSRRHAYLQHLGGRWFCIDLGSRSGLRRGDEPISAGWLRTGEPLNVGPFALEAPGGPAGDDPPSPLEADAGPAGPGGLLLVFPKRNGDRPAWTMNRGLALVGQDRSCRVRLPGSEISARHCALVRTPAGLWVVDLLGREGIRVNGREVRFARLDDGDELRVGRQRIAVRAGVVGLPAVAGRSRLTPTLVGPRPSSSTPAEVSADILGHLTRLVGRMQQQMFEQFQQAMQQQMFEQFQQAMTMMTQMFCAMHHDQAESVRGELARLRQLNEDLISLRAELAGRRGLEAAPSLPASPSLSSSPAPPVAPLVPAPDPAWAPPPPSATEGPSPDGDVHALLNRRIAAIQQESQGLWQRLLDLVTNRGTGGTVP
jgi:pSer/pThr/pTyr-binding forkhead associated (FHA) protein